MRDDPTEAEPPDLGDIGLHHPLDYVEDTVSFLRLSDWTCWPDGGGGWAQQDAFLIADIQNYMAWERRIKWEVKRGISRETPDTPPTPTATVSMDSFYGGG